MIGGDSVSRVVDCEEVGGSCFISVAGLVVAATKPDSARFNVWMRRLCLSRFGRGPRPTMPNAVEGWFVRDCLEEWDRWTSHGELQLGREPEREGVEHRFPVLPSVDFPGSVEHREPVV